MSSPVIKAAYQKKSTIARDDPFASIFLKKDGVKFEETNTVNRASSIVTINNNNDDI